MVETIFSRTNLIYRRRLSYSWVRLGALSQRLFFKDVSARGVFHGHNIILRRSHGWRPRFSVGIFVQPLQPYRPPGTFLDGRLFPEGILVDVLFAFLSGVNLVCSPRMARLAYDSRVVAPAGQKKGHFFGVRGQVEAVDRTPWRDMVLDSGHQKSRFMNVADHDRALSTSKVPRANWFP